MLWGSLQAHTVEECENVKFAKRLSPQIFTKTTDSVWSILTETLSEAPQIEELYKEISDFNPKETNVQKNYEMITFHQNFSYEDFIEGIKPNMSSSFEFYENNLTYEISKGIFHKACTEAVRLAGYANIQECIEDSKESRRAKLESAKPFAIFIDEINRANVSSVFGELITLIEDDKRLGAKNEIIDIQLPYSKTKFAVPLNLHIIGTMNTADRSVESLDTALRRRFSFEEMMPDPASLKKTIDGILLSDLLIKINQRIEVLLDRDHTIGHSYLIDVNDAAELKSAFENKIIPLLQEYFFGDYGKIGLILGEGFVQIHNPKKASFAKFQYDGQDDFVSAKYNLIPITADFDIINAIKLL